MTSPIDKTRSIQVEILNRNYPLRVSPQDEEFTRSLARYVDQRMQAIRKAINERSDLTVAVLAALSLAEDLLTLQASHRAYKEQMERELQALVERLDCVLNEPSTFFSSVSDFHGTEDYDAH